MRFSLFLLIVTILIVCQNDMFSQDKLDAVSKINFEKVLKSYCEANKINYPPTEKKFYESDLNNDKLLDYIVLVTAESTDPKITCVQSLFLLINHNDEYVYEGTVDRVGCCAINDGTITEVLTVKDMIILKKKFKYEDNSVKYKNIEYYLNDFKLVNYSPISTLNKDQNPEKQINSEPKLVQNPKINYIKPLPSPSRKYVFDIKTKFTDKMSVSGAKNGLIAYLKRTSWAIIKETNENYSVWIKNVQRKTIGNKLIINFDFELHTPSMFTEGNLVKKIKISKEYNSNSNWYNTAGNKFANEVFFDELVKIAPTVLALYSGGSAIAITPLLTPVLSDIKNSMNQGETIDQQAEAMIVGAVCTEQLQKWILEIEGRKY